MKSLKATILTEMKLAIQDARLKHFKSIEESVHSVRRRCKRIRAYLDLLSVSLSKESRHATKAVRLASASLSELRDSHVMDQTRRQVLERLNETRIHQQQVIDPDSSLHETAERTNVIQDSAQHQLKSAIHLLDKAKQCISKTPSKQREADVIHKLQKTYKEGRRITRRAADHLCVDDFHDLRKVTKRFCHQCEFVVSAFDCHLKTEIDQARALADKLGNALDLSVLASNLSRTSQEKNAPEFSAMVHESTKHMNTLFGESTHLAYRLYFESPKKLR